MANRSGASENAGRCLPTWGRSLEVLSRFHNGMLSQTRPTAVSESRKVSSMCTMYIQLLGFD